MTLIVHHCDCLLDAPASVVALAYQGYAEVQRARPFILDPIEAGDSLIWVMGESDAPVGVMVNTKKQMGRVLYSRLSYVAPEARRMGVFEALAAKTKELATADPVCLGIEWTTRADNEAMDAWAQKGARRPINLLYRTVVRDERAP